MKIINIENLLENVNTLNSLGCSCCGGKFSTANCDHCDTYNEEANKSATSINQSLSSLQTTIANEQIVLPADFIKIYQIKHSSTINNFLEKNNIGTTIKNNTNDIKEKMIKGEQLTNDEQNYLENSFIYFLKAQEQDYFFDLINKSVLIKKPAVSEETFINIWQAKVNAITKEFYSYNSNITDTSKEKILGSVSQKTRTLKISKETIQSLYNKGLDDTTAIETFFHEFIHLNQIKRLTEGSVNNLDALQNKENLLSKYLPGFYLENYKDLSFEKEAYMLEGIHTLHYLYSLNGILKTEETNLKTNQVYQKLAQDNNIRLFNGKPKDINQEFENFIQDKPFLLNKYNSRYLKAEFIEENGIVRPKTSDELIASIPPDLEVQSKEYYKTLIKRRSNIEQNNNKTITSEISTSK